MNNKNKTKIVGIIPYLVVIAFLIVTRLFGFSKSNTNSIKQILEIEKLSRRFLKTRSRMWLSILQQNRTLIEVLKIHKSS